MEVGNFTIHEDGMKHAGQSLRGIAVALQAEGFIISRAGVKRVIGSAGTIHSAARMVYQG
jgi:hypothetical protein